jgi:hypothetical protein
MAEPRPGLYDTGSDPRSPTTMRAIRPPLTALALLLSLSGCGDGPLQPGRFTLEGRWEGRAFPYAMTLDLRHGRDNRVTGSGELRGLEEVVEGDAAPDTVVTGTVRFSVSGEWSFPTYTLVLASPEFADAVYTGGWAQEEGAPLPDALEGRLEGSGFGTHPLPLSRSP